jgi:hypothetical protein
LARLIQKHPDLVDVIDAWPNLPEPIRALIVNACPSASKSPSTAGAMSTPEIGA